MTMPQGHELRDTETIILPVNQAKLNIVLALESQRSADRSVYNLDETSEDVQNLRLAARELVESDIPVAFPTETVYGLGADATRSSAVRGIYKAKQRPSDNPLIVHVHSLAQLRSLLRGRDPVSAHDGSQDANHDNELSPDPEQLDPIPKIYQSLIEKFWPGPLTLLMPNPKSSKLAPEVTAGLPTFGARMPGNPLALALIELAGIPLAAPSANASTKPSPTTAKHVKHDLNGRIKYVLDGGPCRVGVESTVVDGLVEPPVILRPGGIGLEELRQCPGWENVTVGYKDASELGTAPRAPGMKYRHYSPRAPVILFEAGSACPSIDTIHDLLRNRESLGIIRTKFWPSKRSLGTQQNSTNHNGIAKVNEHSNARNGSAFVDIGEADDNTIFFPLMEIDGSPANIAVWEVQLGRSALDIARGLFAALRDLDQRGVDMIMVEGIDDGAEDVAAAVMNRLRKAAEVRLIS